MDSCATTIKPRVSVLAEEQKHRIHSDALAISATVGVRYVNYGMAGVNAPITPYGALVQLMAEIMAGIILSQVIREGTPVIAGCLNAFMDMHSMLNFYDSTSWLLNLACAEMMAFYRIPHYGNSGNAGGWGADLISAGQQWFNHITACLGTGGMAAFVGTVLGSKVFSPSLIVYANEVIAQARRFADGFDADDSRTLLDEVARAGPGGNYLASDLTLANFRSAYFTSRIFPPLTMEDWQHSGSPRAEAWLRHHTAELAAALPAPADHQEVLERGAAFIDEVWGRRRASSA